MKKNYKYDAMSALQDACLEAVEKKIGIAEYYEEHYCDEDGNAREWAAQSAKEAREIASAMERIIPELFPA